MKLLSLITLSIALLVTPLTGAAKEHRKNSHHVVVSGGQHHGHSGYHHSTRSHKRHYYKHYNKHRSYNRYHNHSSKIATAFIVGAAFGAYGSHHNGHAWCPTHHVYHTHSVSYSHHDNHYYDDRPRKVQSYLEEDEGRCFRVTEYDNGDERRKRIRDHLCDENDWE